MWTRSYSITTKEVTKEQMWKLNAAIDNWKNWDNTLEYAKLLGNFEVGEYFLLKPKGGPRVKIRIIEIAPFKNFTDLTRFPLAKMYGEHRYEETENGLKITVIIKVKGLLGLLWVKLVAKSIVEHLPQQIANQIKHAKEL